MDLLALDIVHMWTQWIWPIALFVIGLGLVVFVHELGHFLVAKAVGIKVERFALGFGPRLLGIQKGDTDYCINLLPLGGYVKMLGQEDLKPLAEGQGDPRAYNNKPVWARLAVVSAGVVMNVLFACALFIIVGMHGKDFMAPYVGNVDPAFPAAQAKITWTNGGCPATQPSQTVGLQSGDRILEINGHEIHRFDQLLVTAILADRNETFQFKIERKIGGKTCVGTAPVSVKHLESADRLAFGITPAYALNILKIQNGKYQAAPYQPGDKNAPGDKIVALNGKPVEYSWELEPFEETLTGDPVRVTVQRPEHGATKTVDLTVTPWMYREKSAVFLKNGTIVPGYIEKMEKDVVTVVEGRTPTTLPADQVVPSTDIGLLDLIGLSPRLKVSMVFDGSPADKVGMQPEDVIVAYGDHAAPTLSQFKETTRKVLETGTTITVLRGDKTVSMKITPVMRNDTPLTGIEMGMDMSHMVVAGVRVGSPAARAGVKPEDVLEAVNGAPVKTWIDLYQALRAAGDKPVALTVRRGSRTETLDAGKLTKSLFDPDLYRFSVLPPPIANNPNGLEPITLLVVKENPLEAIRWGISETNYFLMQGYAQLRSMIRGTVSTKQVMGPVGIADYAIKVGREGLIEFVYFMAMISTILAVMNFLPIPVVDGGHAVLLIVEKLRGKPVPVKIQNIIQIAGLVLLLGVFVAVTWQDISRLIKGLW